MRVLTVNAGSSSLKLALVDHGEAVASRSVGEPAASLDVAWLESALDKMPHPDAVAHRVVHGGVRFAGPAVIDGEVQSGIEALTPLAPLHQPAALAAIRLVAGRLGHLPAVACFDTAFFAALPAEAATYALPRTWRERHGVRRFGFHGLSHGWLSRRAGELMGTDGAPDGGWRLVTCHLGSGASLAAIRGGTPLETTMGFTPAEGLVMATRPGLTDPALAPYLLRRGVTLDELEDGIEHGSGLLGLAGSSDMVAVLERAAAGEPDAQLARDVYLHRLAASVAQMAAAMSGVDAIVLAGGVGENAAAVRSGVARRCAFLGVELDEAANELLGPAGGTISTAASHVRVEVMPAREDLELARQAEQVLAPGRSR